MSNRIEPTLMPPFRSGGLVNPPRTDAELAAYREGFEHGQRAAMLDARAEVMRRLQVNFDALVCRCSDLERERNTLRSALSAAREHILEHGDERDMAPIIQRIDNALHAAGLRALEALRNGAKT
jgi:flagellar biosynthesis/type III secretory pathway protein FliH